MYSIARVKHERTRSLLRGLLHKNVTDKTIKTYDHLRTSTSLDDIEPVANLLIFSPLFAHLDLFDDFPKAPKSADAFYHPVNQPLENELRLQLARIQKNEKRLLEALSSLEQLNNCLLQNDALGSLDRLQHFIEDFGYSTPELAPEI
jgi:hypothetical protein